MLELLVVIGLIAALSFFLLGGLGGGSEVHALQSAQATVASLVTAARTQAAAANRKTRLLVSADPGSPDRYLRQVVLQLARQAGASPADWDTVQSLTLPEGTCVLPSGLNGLVADPAPWKRVTDPSADLVSDLFQNQSLTYALEGDATARLWTGVAFTPNGTLAALATGPPPKGCIVLTACRARPPGSFPPGDPPVQLVRPETVRGLVLSAYGIPALLNDRNAF